MIWIFWSCLSALSIAGILTIMRYFAPGEFVKGYFIYITGVIFLTGWILPYSYMVIPESFIKPYILQTGLITLFGMILSKFIFGDVLLIIHYIGISLIIIGTILLGIKY